MLKFEDVLGIINQKYKLITLENDKNDTTKGYQVEGFRGKIGFITSMTSHFCGGCNRLRLTADGNLKVCLFSNRELNLKKMIRENESEEKIYNLINEHVKAKKFSHDGMFEISKQKNRPMITIGG